MLFFIALGRTEKILLILIIVSHCVLGCMFISANHKRNEKSVMLYNLQSECLILLCWDKLKSLLSNHRKAMLGHWKDVKKMQKTTLIDSRAG